MMAENRQNIFKYDTGCAVGVNGMREKAEKLDKTNKADLEKQGEEDGRRRRGEWERERKARGSCMSTRL